jgi:hypothetical protein
MAVYGNFNGYLVHFPRLGIFYHEKYDNPDLEQKTLGQCHDVQK